jgi:hypothetical protein
MAAEIGVPLILAAEAAHAWRPERIVPLLREIVGRAA